MYPQNCLLYTSYTSNVFAILGLRSMYFLLAAGKRYLRHLEKSVVIILAYLSLIHSSFRFRL